MNDERWGIYDKQDNVWIGNDHGPVTFDDYMIARVAAQVSEDMLYGSDLGGRHEARVYPGGPVRLREEVKNKHTPLESLQRIEGSKDDGTPPVKIELTTNPVGDWVRPPNE